MAGSTYELYRALLRIRRERRLGGGGLWFVEGYGAGVLAFRVATPGRAGVLVLANLGDAPVPLPDRPILVGTADGGPKDGVLPVDATVWLAD